MKTCLDYQAEHPHIPAPSGSKNPIGLLPNYNCGVCGATIPKKLPSCVACAHDEGNHQYPTIEHPRNHGVRLRGYTGVITS